MESFFKNSTEPILSFSKNNEPRIDFKQRIYGVKGKKLPSASFKIFKCSQLRACNASLNIRYEADGQIAQPLEIIKCNDRHHIDCVTDITDDFVVDKFIRYVEHRIVNEPNTPTYQIYECSRQDWVSFASKQEPRVGLPDFPDYLRYSSRFYRLRKLLRGCKKAMSISEVKVDPLTGINSNKNFECFTSAQRTENKKYTTFECFTSAQRIFY